MSLFADCSSFRLVGVAVVLLCGGLSCSGFGEQEHPCVAPCGSPERSFIGIHTSGFTPPQSSAAMPDSCRGVSADDGEMRLRFVLGDQDGRPIRLGEVVNGRSVDTSTVSLALHDSALMEVSQSGACSSSEVCAGDFTCGLAPGLPDDATLQACLLPDEGQSVSSGPNALTFVSDIGSDQVYGLLMESTGSLTGWNPEGANGAWDKDADGVAETANTDAPQLGAAIATDSQNHRWAAVQATRRHWAQIASIARAEERETYFGLWTFNDTNLEPTSHVASATQSEIAWTSDTTEVADAIDDYTQVPDRNSRANVYEAIETLIADEYSDQAMSELGAAQPASVDKQLVVFVDGYDDLRETDAASIDRAIEAAKAHNVRVFIVHLDPKIDEPEMLRDDPRYPSGQTVCTEDSDCKNFEACTRPRGYADMVGEDAQAPSDYDLSETYCIPRHDDFGRTGPIHDYARLACASGGGYMYVSSPEAIANNLSWTPLALEGLWEAKVGSAAIARGQTPPEAPLRVHTEVSVDVAGMSRVYPFTQVGNPGASHDSSTGGSDTRGVVFTAP